MVSVSQCHESRHPTHFANAHHAHHHHNLTNGHAQCRADQLLYEQNRFLLFQQQQHLQQQQQPHKQSQSSATFSYSSNQTRQTSPRDYSVESIYESSNCPSGYRLKQRFHHNNNHLPYLPTMTSLFTSASSGIVNVPNSSHSDAGHDGASASGPGNDHGDLPLDVKKAGFMRKLKTNGRKYFVLRLNSNSDVSDATISYYDNEKKFRTNMEPSSALCKGKLLLRECFAIQRKNDHKDRHVIGIYTPSDLFGCVCDDENDMLDWLEAFNDILECCQEYIDRQFRDFEHIWQASIQQCGLVNAKTISGLYRFCLLENNLYIIKVDGNLYSQEVYECPLQGIRRCGHSLTTFFLELGRSSIIGPGELWLTTEDASSAQNMHEIILNAMSAGSEQSDDDLQRFRASSLSSSHRGHRPRSSSASVPSHHPSVMDHSYSRQRKSNASDIGRNPGMNSTNKIHRPNSSSGVCTSFSGTASSSGTVSTQNVATGMCERSRNTSECSVEDYCDCMLNIVHCNDVKGCCSSSAYNSNISIDGSTTSSSMDFHDPTSVHHHSHAHSHSTHTLSHMNPHLHHHSGEHLTLEPSISEEVDGCYTEDCCNNPLANDQTCPAPSTSSRSLKKKDSRNVSSSTISSVQSSTPSTTLVVGPSPPFKTHQSHVEHRSHQQLIDTLQNRHSTSDITDTEIDPTKPMHGPVRPPPKTDVQPSPLKTQDAPSTEPTKPVHGPARPPSSSENHQSPSLTSVSSTNSNQNICVHLTHLRSSRSGSISDRNSCNLSTCCHHQVQSHGYQGIQHHHPQPQTSPILSPKCTCSSCQQGMFQTLPTVPAGTDDDYLPMAPLNAGGTVSPTAGSSTNSSKTGTRSTEDEEDSAYLMMSPQSYGQNSSEKQAGNGNNVGTTVSKKNDCIFDGLTRAYSTGSKPKPLAPSIAAQCTVSTQTETSGGSQNDSQSASASSRIRALSTGSHSLTFKAFRLKVQGRNKQKSLDSGCARDMHHSSVSMETPTDVTTSAFSSSASSASLLDSEAENLTCKNSKASSAPILSACINQRVRSATIGARPSPFGGVASTHSNHHHHCHVQQHHQCHLHNIHHTKAHPTHGSAQFYSPGSAGNHHTNPNGTGCISGGNHYIPLSASQRKLNVRRHLHCCQQETEPDLMEITYQQKPRRDSCGEIIGSFEEESRRNRSRKSSTSTDNNATPTNNAEHSESGPRKRSGSTSALSFPLGNKNIPKAGANTISKTTNTKSSHMGSFTKLDNLLQGFRSISLHQKGTNHRNTSNQKTGTNDLNESPLHRMNSKPVKMNSMLKKIHKEASRETLARQKSAEEREKKLAAAKAASQNSKNSTSPTAGSSPPAANSGSGSTAAKTDLETLTRKLEEKARQMDEEHRKICSSDEESPYVLVVPSDQLSTVSSNNVTQNGTSGKAVRKKSSVVRSFISSFGTKENDGSDKKDEGTGEVQRKKSSTSFSGKLKIGRPGSAGGGKKISVSESDGISRSPTSSPTPTKT